MKSFIPLSFRLAPQSLFYVLITRSPMLPCALALVLLSSPAVVFAQWEPDVRLTFNNTYSYASFNNARCICTNGDSVYVTWWDYQVGNYDIYFKCSVDGGAHWTQNIQLTNDTVSSWLPSVAVSGPNIHIVWQDQRDGNWEIYYKRSTNGGIDWGPDARLTDDTASSENPTVSVSGSNIHIVWQDNRNVNWRVYYKRSSDNGATWSSDVRLSNTTATTWFPSVTSTDSLVHVVWDDYRNGNREIYYKRSTDGGVIWDPDTRLTNDSAYSAYPCISVSSSDVHVVWDEGRNGNPEIYYKRSTDNGITWDPDTRLTADSAWSNRPSIAVSGFNIHVIWQDNRDGNEEIYYNCSRDRGTTWGPATRLTSDTAWSGLYSIAVGASNIHVIWCDTRDGNYEIYYKRNPTGNSGVELSPPSHLTPYASRLTVSPNPFTSFATLPGHESECFALYDISGRRVGVYRGYRVGAGLAPGVYFLRPEGRDAKPLRIVKLR